MEVVSPAKPRSNLFLFYMRIASQSLAMMTK